MSRPSKTSTNGISYRKQNHFVVFQFCLRAFPVNAPAKNVNNSNIALWHILITCMVIDYYVVQKMTHIDFYYIDRKA